MLHALREAALRFIDAPAGPGPFATAVPGVTLLRSDHARRTDSHICRPALCIVPPGRAKWTTFGKTRFDYHAWQAMVVNVELPAFSTVVEASPRHWRPTDANSFGSPQSK